jgi:hypothetical protein
VLHIASIAGNQALCTILLFTHGEMERDLVVKIAIELFAFPHRLQSPQCLSDFEPHCLSP